MTEKRRKWFLKLKTIEKYKKISPLKYRVLGKHCFRSHEKNMIFALNPGPNLYKYKLT